MKLRMAAVVLVAGVGLTVAGCSDGPVLDEDRCVQRVSDGPWVEADDGEPCVYRDGQWVEDDSGDSSIKKSTSTKKSSSGKKSTSKSTSKKR